jgi:hypothetical protein
MVAFGALFAIQIAKFFNGVFNEGLQVLEGTVKEEVASGQGFAQ